MLKNSILLWTELSHNSYTILNDMKVKSKINFNTLSELKKLAEINFRRIKNNFNIQDLMKDLESAWELKKNYHKKLQIIKLIQ